MHTRNHPPPALSELIAQLFPDQKSPRRPFSARCHVDRSRNNSSIQGLKEAVFGKRKTENASSWTPVSRGDGSRARCSTPPRTMGALYVAHPQAPSQQTLTRARHDDRRRVPHRPQAPRLRRVRRRELRVLRHGHHRVRQGVRVLHLRQGDQRAQGARDLRTPNARDAARARADPRIARHDPGNAPQTRAAPTRGARSPDARVAASTPRGEFFLVFPPERPRVLRLFFQPGGRLTRFPPPLLSARVAPPPPSFDHRRAPSPRSRT